jgi:hypothetical protein
MGELLVNVAVAEITADVCAEAHYGRDQTSGNAEWG